MEFELLGGRYQLDNPIGRGAMATIYRGQDILMDRVVAVKVLREVYSTDPKFVTRFQRDAKIPSILQHPNIVQFFDYGQTNGIYYIVMELVEGTDLRRYLHSRRSLDADTTISIAHDTALGLGAAHSRGIVHHNVKPRNVLVGRGGGSIKLADFCMASMSLDGVRYQSPEHLQGEIVTSAADVYSLGTMMYEMLTGNTPFDGDTPVAVAMKHIQETPISPIEFNASIPVPLEEIVMRCVEKEPEMRFRDGSELARALEQCSMK